MIQKNLKVGWYPFGDYQEPNEKEYVVLDDEKERQRAERNKLLYSIGENAPEVNVCCIAGMNGSGKSSLLDIMIRIINNVAYSFLVDTGAACPTEAHGVEADLHFEVDGIPGCVRCTKDYTKLFWGKDTLGKCRRIDNHPRDAYKQLKDFFYTVCINYSIYSFNVHDYKPTFSRISNLSRGMDGKWLLNTFHKNDGYLTPLVLAPFRDKDGNIDMKRERKLANQRLVTLILFFYLNGKEFIEGYRPTTMSWKFNKAYLQSAKNKLHSDYYSEYGSTKFGRKLGEFTTEWRRYFKDKGYDEGTLKAAYDPNLWETCTQYLAYKSLKICSTYSIYEKLYAERNEHPGRIREIVDTLAETLDHITVKIHQCLHFMESNDYRDNKSFVGVEKQFEAYKGQVDGYDKMMTLLPPSFFEMDLDMSNEEHVYRQNGVIDLETGESPVAFVFSNKFSINSMSSGERQFLNSISYALYHIKNLEGITEGHNRVHYSHINLVLDEVELYYHPEYQRRFIKMLLESLSWCKFDKSRIKSINILVVTHSPFILSDIVQDNVLYLENGVSVKKHQGTFGANFYDLLYDSFFFTKNAIGEIATDVITKIIQNPNDYRNHKWLIDIISDPIIKGHLLNKLAEKDV